MKIEYAYLTALERHYWDSALPTTSKNDMKKFIKALRRDFPYNSNIGVGDIRKNMVINTTKGLFAYSLGTDKWYELETL